MFAPGITRALTRALAHAAPPAPADCLVVLGGGVRADGSMMPSTRERVEAAVRLYREGFATHLLLCGGGPHLRHPEADVMWRAALERGVPREHLVVERSSSNTFENARYAAAILRDRGWRRALLVTSPSHLHRALAVFRGAGVDAHGYHDPEAALRFYSAAREVVGIGLYKLLGWM